jgi:hypothetical protein
VNRSVAPHSKKVQTNPPGTLAEDTSLLKKVKPPMKLMQASDTTGMSSHPWGGLREPVQTVMVADTSCA